MVYKQKLILLSVLIVFLALANALAFFVNSGSLNRKDSFSWLEKESLGRVDGIEIGREDEERLNLVRRNNSWYVYREGKDYPAKQERVGDLLALLTKKDAYPLRASSASSHARLGLEEKSAVHLRLRAGAGLPLLDLLAGSTDATGREIYLRRASQDEVRSAGDSFTPYISGGAASWYNLRLFPVSGPRPADVQRVRAFYPRKEGEEVETTAEFTRNGNEWTVSGAEILSPDGGKIDSWIQAVLNTEAEDFSSAGNTAGNAAGSGVFSDARLILEFGNGSISTMSFGPADSANRRDLSLSGADYVYTLAGWAVDRIFREPSSFEKQ